MFDYRIDIKIYRYYMKMKKSPRQWALKTDFLTTIIS